MLISPLGVPDAGDSGASNAPAGVGQKGPACGKNSNTRRKDKSLSSSITIYKAKVAVSKKKFGVDYKIIYTGVVFEVPLLKNYWFSALIYNRCQPTYWIHNKTNRFERSSVYGLHEGRAALTSYLYKRI